MNDDLLPAALYARVSRKEQEDNYSVPSQFRKMHAKIEKLGWRSTFEKTDVKSGGNLERKGLDEIRELARKGLIRGLLVYDLDRLSRSLRDGLNLIDEFRACGVAVQSCKQNLDDEDAEDEATESFWDAQKERKKIRERTMRGRAEKAEEGGLPYSQVPYGYEYVYGVRERGKEHRASTAVILEAEATIVRQVFALRASGKSYYSIATWLNTAGVKTRNVGRPEGAPPSRWSKQTVLQMLNQEAYIGSMYWHKGKPDQRIIPCPAIVSRELWDAAHARAKQLHTAIAKVGRPSKKYLLVGKLFCGACLRKDGRTGETRPSRWTAHRNHGYPLYLCNNRQRWPHQQLCPDRSMVSVRILDASIWDALVEALRRPHLLWPDIEAHVNRENRKAGADDKLKAKERAERTAKAQLEIASDGELPDDVRAEARRKAAAAHRLVKQMAAELAAAGRMIVLPPKSEFMKRCEEIGTRIQRVESFETKRAIVEELVDKILYSKGMAQVHCRVGCADSALQNGNSDFGAYDHFAAVPFILNVKVA